MFNIAIPIKSFYLLLLLLLLLFEDEFYNVYAFFTIKYIFY